MSLRSRQVITWIHYAEYVAAWVPIHIKDRPKFRVVRYDGDWVAVLRGPS